MLTFTPKQPVTNYTIMINKVENGYILHLLNDDGETVRTLIAARYSLRDYSEYSFCSAIEALWDYAESLNKTAQEPMLDEAAQESIMKEAKESEL